MSAFQFAGFRWLFGIYLLVHFAHLLPWSEELFSADGVFPDPSTLPLHGLFPNALVVWDSPSAVRAFVVVLCVASVAFGAGVLRPFMAVVLWYGWTCLFNRNPLIANPSLPYVGLILLLCAMVPRGEGLGLTRRRPVEGWTMPRWVPRTAFFVLAAGYTYSGLVKLQSPSWLNGQVIALLLDNPLARPGTLRNILSALPPMVFALVSWGSLAVEILALPLALWRRSRWIAWGATLLMQLGILLVISFADLTWGMVMVHLFAFDPKWLCKRGTPHLRTMRGQRLR